MRKIPLLTRLRAKRRNQSMLVGITWYTEESWAQVKALAVDPERFEDSFIAWEAIANTARRDLQRAGVRAVEFQIIPQQLFEWCATNNKENNAGSRAEFVSEKLSLGSGT
jgi:hypothetical protein